MAHTLSYGGRIENEFKLVAKHYRGEKLTKEEIETVLAHMAANFDAAMRVDYDCITLRHENLRLQHENEFMYRLINERNQ